MSDSKVEKKVQRLLWLDLEMTGLDVRKEVIIEVAAIVTDISFNTLGSYHCVVQQASHYLEAMDDWNKKHHGASGLIAKVPNGKLPSVVETDLLNLVAEHFGSGKDAEKPILAGNSIGQDRLFVDAQLPRFAQKLHYRMLDVSSWKIIFNNKLGLKYQKSSQHRALDDIQESIAELKFYLSHLREDLASL